MVARILLATHGEKESYRKEFISSIFSLLKITYMSSVGFAFVFQGLV
jgi:hypothetical protein